MLITLFQTGFLQLDQRSVSAVWGWLFTLVLASLVVIGVFGLSGTILMTGTSIERRRALAKKATNIDLLARQFRSLKEFPQVPRAEDLTNSPGIKLDYRLPMERSPGWRLLVVGVFALLWNGLVGFLVWLHFEGNTDWYLTGLTIPFAAFGVAVVVFFFYLILLATAIGPTSMEISTLPIVPGAKIRLFLTQAGRLSVRHLTVTLVCEEEASFRQGTDTRVERCRVYEREIFSKANFEILPEAPFEFECELDFPDRVMHSFQSDHNAVHWRLSVSGEFEKWPGSERNFPIIVYPAKLDVRE